jgi:hypothetical protein
MNSAKCGSPRESASIFTARSRRAMWADVDFENRVVRVQETKNGHPHAVPLNEAPATAEVSARSATGPAIPESRAQYKTDPLI